MHGDERRADDTCAALTTHHDEDTVAIYPHSNETETRWGRGDFQAMIKSPTSDRPVAYCDGTPEDEATLVETAEAEGLDSVRIDRKHLKTGREIWTVVGETGYSQEEGDW